MLRKLWKRATAQPSGPSPQPAGDDQPTPKNIPNAPRPITRYAPEMPVLPVTDDDGATVISFVLIVYKMPDQADKTLHSLSTAYQRGVAENDYEVIVVENDSPELLGEERALRHGNNVRYFHRHEIAPTPVPAINFGASQARGSHICVMIDGARMITPGVVNYMIAAAHLSPEAIVAVPGYHLGPKKQQESMLEGYNEQVERGLLDSIGWPTDGYRLFEIACLSGTCAGGVFKPIGESNCFCVPRHIFEKLGGYDERFTETGGGQVNLDFYKRTVELPETLLVTLLGEGSFHQFHGGVTTGQTGERRKQAMEAHFSQYSGLRGGPYEPPEKRSVYLGAVPDRSLKFLRHGINTVIEFNNLDG